MSLHILLFLFHSTDGQLNLFHWNESEPDQVWNQHKPTKSSSTEGISVIKLLHNKTYVLSSFFFSIWDLTGLNLENYISVLEIRALNSKLNSMQVYDSVKATYLSLTYHVLFP